MGENEFCLAGKYLSEIAATCHVVAEGESMPFFIRYKEHGLWKESMSCLLVLAMSGCSVPHLTDYIPQHGDERPFEKPLEVNRRHNILAIGWDAVVGVKEDGTVWAWGSGTRGQLGNGKQSSSSSTPIKVEGLEDIIEVAGTGSHFLALKRDGTVWSWGDNKLGQLGYKTEDYFSAIPRKITILNNIVSVAAAAHSLALDSSGRIWAFGSNGSMALGISPKDDAPHYSPLVVFEHGEAIKVVANAGVSGVLTSSGEIYLWGGNGFLHSYVEKTLPKKYDIPIRAVDVVIGEAMYVLSSEGFVWAQAGSNTSGLLGQGDFKEHAGLVKVKNVGRVISVAAPYLSGAALDERGRIWQWGNNVRFKGAINIRHNYEPYPVLIGKIPKPMSMISIFASAALASDGKVYFWGLDEGRRGTRKPRYKQWFGWEWAVPELSDWSWR